MRAKLKISCFLILHILQIIPLPFQSGRQRAINWMCGLSKYMRGCKLGSLPTSQTVAFEKKWMNWLPFFPLKVFWQNYPQKLIWWSMRRLLHLYLDKDVLKISKFRLSQTSIFQTLITQKWLKITMSFFHILKNWYSELHMALVSCPNLNLSLNDSWYSVLNENCQFLALLSILKKCLTLNGCSIQTTQPKVN